MPAHRSGHVSVGGNSLALLRGDAPADMCEHAAMVRGHSDHHPTAPAVEDTGHSLPLTYSVALGVLVAAATLYGLLAADAYRSVPDLLEQTWRAQDAVTLATVPVLVLAHRAARAGSFPAHLLWVGLLTWLTYCYAHLAVGAAFNVMFLVYVAVLALAGFAMLDGLVRIDVAGVDPAFARAPGRITAWFLTIAALGIAALWLSEIVPGLVGRTPPNIHLGGLPNPTWVLDLAWIIPFAIGAAVQLFRRHPAGPVLAAIMLVMLLVLSVGMLLITPFALAAGLGGVPEVSVQLVVFSVLFTVLGVVELILLIRGARLLGPVPRVWLRPGWWPGVARRRA